MAGKVVFVVMSGEEPGELESDLKAYTIHSFPDELHFCQASPVGEQGFITKAHVPALIQALQAWAET